jgi:hypothetical protein
MTAKGFYFLIIKALDLDPDLHKRKKLDRLRIETIADPKHL